MPALRTSTLKQRARAKANMPPLRTHTVRRKAAKELDSFPPNSNGLGTMTHIPYELRQAIFEQLVPPEISPAAMVQSFETDKESSDKNNLQYAAGTPTGLLALLCTSKAISAEVRRSYQNREYLLYLSASGIIFEDLRSAVEFRCWCNTLWPVRVRCNHCVKGLIWKVANSSQTRPLSRCRALRALKAIQPMMRRLHVTFTVTSDTRWFKWRNDINRICSAGRIWDIVRKAKLAGVKVKFTALVLDRSRPGADWASMRPLQGILPAQYEYETNVKHTDLPVKHPL
jgi:hypothetical protein